MNKILPFLLLTAVLLGQDSSVEKIITDHYYYPTEGLSKIVVKLSYSLGEATISPGKSDAGITGKIRYLPRIQQPVISFTKSGTVGYFDLEIENVKAHFDKLDDIGSNNELELFFPVDLPQEIYFEMGLGEAEIDLTGLSIEELELESGISDIHIFVGEPNKTVCRQFEVKNGIGDFNGNGLGNLRARRINLEVGLGNMEMDLTGDVIEDCELRAEVGLGSLDIVLPEDINGYADVNKSFLSSVSLPAGFTSEKLPGRKTVQLYIDVGVGSVDVRQR